MLISKRVLCRDALRPLESRVARFLLLQHTKNGRISSNNHKMYQMTKTILKSNKIDQMAKIHPNRDFWFENMPSGNPA
jgi:hypothetical protein